MAYRLIFILLCFFVPSCQNSTPSIPHSEQEIEGRAEGIPPTRFPVYHAQVPKTWIRKDAPQPQSLQDSTLPICEFFIREDQKEIRITVHNFPHHSLETRVPPLAQISRWKKQFEQLDPLQQYTQPQSWGGFVGLFFEGSGRLKGEKVKMVGWSTQLARDHFLNVQQEQLLLPDPYFKQALADYTIKAVGPKEFVEQHQSDIEAFAHSFELIKELPKP